MPLLVLMVAPGAHAETWVVIHNGTGTAPNIQEAIRMGATGDTVLVGPGTYSESINFLGKGIVLESVAGPTATILDGFSTDDAVIQLQDQEPLGTEIRGFTVRNGRGHWRGGDEGDLSGGAIYIMGPAHLLLEGNVFEDNSARWGGVITAWTGYEFEESQSPTLIIRGNVFRNNYADSGGGVLRFANVKATVTENLFETNTARNDGGAIYLTGGFYTVYIFDNEFLENESGDKGGAIWAHSTPGSANCVISNNLFAKNRAFGRDWMDIGTGGAMALGLQSGGTIQNNTIVLNEGRGETNCSGGGIALVYGQANLTITHNVIAYNTGCGIACLNSQFNPTLVNMGPNLFWKNDSADIGNILDVCPIEWESSVIANDPRFCDLKGGVFTVEKNSPAITNPLGIFGIYANPGCPSIVPVQMTTWSAIKRQFHPDTEQ